MGSLFCPLEMHETLEVALVESMFSLAEIDVCNTVCIFCRRDKLGGNAGYTCSYQSRVSETTVRSTVLSMVKTDDLCTVLPVQCGGPGSFLHLKICLLVKM